MAGEPAAYEGPFIFQYTLAFQFRFTYISFMSRMDEAIKAIADSEAALRRLASDAASAGDYDELAGLVEAAKTLAGLIKRMSSGVPGTAPRPDAAENGQVPETQVKEVAVEWIPVGGGKGRKKAEYPQFRREGQVLVKIGWSKSNKSTYQHKAPIEAVLALCAALGKVTATRRQFSMEDVLPKVTLGDGSEVPSYQTYVAFSWVRSLGLVQQHGRQGYSLAGNADLVTRVREAWGSLS